MRQALPRPAVLAAIVSATVFASAFGALRLVPVGTTVAPLWVANALAIVLVLRMARSRNDLAAGFAAVLAAGLAAQVATGRPAPLAAALAVVNLAEVAVAVALGQRFSSLVFKSLNDGWRFFAVAGAPPALLGGACTALLCAVSMPGEALRMGGARFAADLLGFILVAPFGMTVSRRTLAALDLRSRVCEALGVALLVLAAVLGAFAQRTVPLFFMVTPFVLLATFRFRLLGANGALLIVAVLAVPLTYAGLGPLAAVNAPWPGLKIFGLQLFLAVNALTSTPIAAALSERDYLARVARRREGELAEANLALVKTIRSGDFAERVAGVGHWRIELPERELMWSAGVFAIFGRDPALGPLRIAELAAAHVRDEQDGLVEGLHAALDTRSDLELDHTIVRADGERRHLHTRARFTADPAREGAGTLMGMTMDVTERTLARAAAAEAEASYRLLAETATEVVTRVDADGRLQFVSPSCLKVLGQPPEAFIGRTVMELMHPDDRERVGVVVGALLRSGAPHLGASLEYRLRHADGRWLWMAANPAPVRDADGRARGVVDMLRDVTARHELEGQLIASREAAEAAARAKADFLANMSHELRTPLNSIVGFAGLIAEAPELAAETRRRAELVAGASRSLVAVVNDVLDVSRFESEGVKLRLEPALLRGVLSDAVELIRGECEAKGVRLVFTAPDDDALVWLDAPRVRQVALNLLGNAVKFTPAGDIEVTLAHEGSGALRVAVRDTGIGIPADRRQAVFERFAQADASTSRSYGGTGLGLAICRTLVEAMGGEIGVASEEGRGSTFWFTLRPAPAEGGTAAPAPAPAQPPELRGLRVLLAEDQAINRDLFRALLTGVELDLTEAADGAEAVRAVEAQPFDLVFMDLQMPLMSGLEAARRIRAKGFDRLAIVALTANALPEEVERCLAAGMDDHLAKPYGRQDVLDMLARYASRDAEAPAAAPPPEPEEMDERIVEELRQTVGAAAFDTFLSRLAEQLREMAGLLAEDALPPQGLAARCHSARGLAGTLGFARLAAAYGDLERACEAGAADARRGMLHREAAAATERSLEEIARRLTAA